MTRREVLLLPLSGFVVAQVSEIAQAPLGKTQIQPHSTAARPEEALVRWNPRPVLNWAPVLFQSKSFSGAGIWLNKKIEFRTKFSSANSRRSTMSRELHGARYLRWVRRRKITTGAFLACSTVFSPICGTAQLPPNPISR